jgi:hypothetical protein
VSQLEEEGNIYLVIGSEFGKDIEEGESIRMSERGTHDFMKSHFPCSRAIMLFIVV